MSPYGDLMFTRAYYRQYGGERGEAPIGLCTCGCHHPQKPPPATEARLCHDCAEERFASWKALVDVLMRDD
jgi:hypothetical protein